VTRSARILGRALLVGSVGVWCALSAAAQSGTVVARAASVSGPTLLASPSGATVALTAGSILNPGDRIDTRAGGQVVIDLSDGSMVVVSPGSLILLKDFRQASSLRELFEITLGMVRVKINHFSGRPNPYRMNSPTASIAVRGTEFSIHVDALGTTAVIVYEGLVEVSELSDPSQTGLVEAGRGVLVQTGQALRFFAAPQGHAADQGDHNPAYDADHHGAPPPPVAANGPEPPPPPAAPAAMPQQPSSWPAAPNGHPDSSAHNDGDPATGSATQGANSSAYDRYISGLADVYELPFLLRYNAFADSHLDSLENPAYATQFHEAEGRFFLMPSYSGTAGLTSRETPVTPGGAVPGDYSVSPQFSIFSPLGGTGLVIGGSISASRVGNSSGLDSSNLPYASTYSAAGSGSGSLTGGAGGGGSVSDYYSGSLVLAASAGRSSFGAEFESLRGSGTAQTLMGDLGGGGSGQQAPISLQSVSTISENRLTAGYSFDISKTARLGVFYRYAFISGTDADTGTYPYQTAAPYETAAPGNSTSTTGHSSEIGMRWRGRFSKRLSYGFNADWLGLSLLDGLVRQDAVDSHQRDSAVRGSLGFGLGYQLTRRVELVWDLAGASTHSEASRFADATGSMLQNGIADSHLLSAHAAVMADLTRRLFVTASLMYVWHGSYWNVALYPDQYGNRTLVEDSFFPLYSAVYPIAPRFSDFGAGWRFSRNLLLEYLFSTDYGFSGSSHTLMVRYIFRLKKE
jgi:FecR protein